MARIRTIKPEFFKNYKLYLAEQETNLPLRTAFPGLWCCADREGRFKWSPEELKIDCLPYDDLDFSRVLHALLTRHYIEKYVENDIEYGWIPSFLDHQVINNRESESKFPEITKSNIINDLTRDNEPGHACFTRHPRASELLKGKGKEGKGKDIGTRHRRGKNIPPSLEEIQTYCNERKNQVDPERFKNFYDSKGWMVGKNKMKDWMAAIRTWEEKKPKTDSGDYL